MASSEQDAPEDGFENLPPYPSYTLKESATEPAITEPLKNGNGETVDLSPDGTVVLFYLQHYETGAMVVDGAEATITDAANGEVRFEIPPDKLGFEGPHAGAFVVVRADGTAEYPSESYIRVDVTAALASGNALNPDTEDPLQERGPPGPVGPEGPPGPPGEDGADGASVSLAEDGATEVDILRILNVADNLEVTPADDGSGEATLSATVPEQAGQSALAVEDDGVSTVDPTDTLDFGANLSVQGPPEPVSRTETHEVGFASTFTYGTIDVPAGATVTVTELSENSSFFGVSTSVRDEAGNVVVQAGGGEYVNQSGALETLSWVVENQDYSAHTVTSTITYEVVPADGGVPDGTAVVSAEVPDFEDTDTHATFQNEDGSVSVSPDSVVLGDNLTLTDEGNGTIRVDGVSGSGGGSSSGVTFPDGTTVEPVGVVHISDTDGATVVDTSMDLTGDDFEAYRLFGYIEDTSGNAGDASLEIGVNGFTGVSDLSYYQQVSIDTYGNPTAAVRDVGINRWFESMEGGSRNTLNYRITESPMTGAIITGLGDAYGFRRLVYGFHAREGSAGPLESLEVVSLNSGIAELYVTGVSY